MKTKILLFAILSLLLNSACTTVPERTADEQTVIDAFIGHATSYAEGLTQEKVAASCEKSPEGFAWVEFRYLKCLAIAYELTGDTTYLDLLSDRLKLFEGILSAQEDEFSGWYGNAIDPRKPDMIEGKLCDEVQCNFRAMETFARWIELAKQNPEYAEQNQELIASRTDLIDNHLFPKWDKRGFFTEIEGRGGVYHGLEFPSRFDLTLSHEKHSIAVKGLLAAYRATGNEACLKRALQIGAWYKSCLELKDGHYEWMSWVPAGKWDISPDKENAWKVSWIAPDPNAMWYITSQSIALNLYQHGLLFTDEDIERFVQTQKTMCWNGDMENPQYRNVAGQTSKWIKGQFLSHQLAHYDPVLQQLAFDGPHEADALKNITNPWHGGANAQFYIREKFVMRPIVAKNPQPYKKVGEKFLKTEANRAFYDELKTVQFHPVPLKPSEMK